MLRENLENLAKKLDKDIMLAIYEKQNYCEDHVNDTKVADFCYQVGLYTARITALSSIRHEITKILEED